MPKIALIGAGSIVFAKRLCIDILSWPALQESTIALMDIDAERLEMIATLIRRVIAEQQLPAKVIATLDRREALDGADFVITTIAVGDMETVAADRAIPRKYGVRQTVADTLGPGGIFRALRILPVLLDICHDMEELCPNALLLQYSNPMAINIWAINAATRIKSVGLCHSVQGTSRQLADYIGAPYEEIGYYVAGINHQAWFLRFEWNGKDAYPLLYEAMQNPEIYDKDRVRWEILRYFGAFVTESSHHMSEYVPYFRRTDEQAQQYTEAWENRFRGYDASWMKKRQEEYYGKIRDEVESTEPIAFNRTHEYGSFIINSVVTDTPFRIAGNVINNGLITNLPPGCCVEVPCLVDRMGIHPTYAGDLPPQLAGLNRTNINVQSLVVKAVLEQDRTQVYYAVQLDPLTQASCGLPEMRAMTDELFQASAKYLSF